MKIKVTLPRTIFGEIVKTFDNYSDAMDWIEVCIQNDLKVIIEKI
jgi:hypothetical protein